MNEINTKKQFFRLSPEELINLHDQYNTMPECAEKIIQKLMHSMYLLLEGGSNQVMDSKIELGRMVDRLCMEDSYSNEIESQVNLIKTFIDNNDYCNAITEFKLLLSKLRDINIQELFQLIMKNKGAMPLIRNKKIYILFGLTGSGKSTTLHFLGGSRMEKNALNHIAPGEISNEYLRQVTTSASMNSETRHLIPVIMHVPRNPRLPNRLDEVIICDSPGFEDSSGAEFDIANSVAIKQAIEVCEAIKPIVVVSKQLGDRFERLNVLTQVLMEMLDNPEQVEKFAYVYTKFEESEYESIMATLSSIETTIQENEKVAPETIDRSLKTVVTDMINKADKMVIIDPINPINRFYTIQQICDNNFILHPNRAFNISFSNKTKNKIEKQFNKHFKFIEKAIKRKEYDLAIFKIKELIQLKDIIQQSEVDENFRLVILNMKKSFDENFQIQTSYLKRKIQKEKCDPLDKSDLESYKLSMEDAKHVEKLFEMVGETNMKTYQKLQDELIDLINNSVVEKMKLKNIFNQIDSIKIDLDNLKLISESFDENESIRNIFKKKYDEACQLVRNEINSKVDPNNNQLINASDFYHIAKVMTNIEKLSELKDHFDDLNTCYETIKTSVLEFLNEKSDKFRKFFQQVNNNLEVLKDSTMETYNLFDEHFSAAKHCVLLHKHIPISQIEQAHNNFLQPLTEYVNSIKNTIENDIQERNYGSVEEAFKKLLIVRINDNFARVCEASYSSVYDSLLQLIYQLRDTTNGYLSETFQVQTLTRRKANEICEQLQLLKNFKWFDNHKRNVCQNILINLEKRVSDFIEGLTESLESLNLRLDNPAHLKEIYEIIRKIVLFEQLLVHFEGLRHAIDEKKLWFKNGINTKFRNFISIYQNYEQLNRIELKINYDEIEHALNYLESCNEFDIQYKDKFYAADDKVKKVLQNRFNFLGEQYNSLFHFIENSNNSEEANSKAEDLLKVLNEYQLVKSHFPRVSRFLPTELLQNWSTRLNNKFNEFQLYFMDRFQENRLTKLSICQVFGKFDQYLSQDHLGQGRSFNSLFLNYSNDVRQERREIFEEARRLLNECRFVDLCEILNTFDQSEQLDSYYLNVIKACLKSNLKEMLLGLKTRVRSLNNMDIDISTLIEEIITKIDNFERAKDYLSLYLTDDSKVELKNILDEIKELVKKSFKKYVDDIKKLYSEFSLAEGNRRINDVRRLRPLLVVLDDSLKELDSLNPDSILLESIKKFSEYKIDQFIFHPPNQVFQILGNTNQNARTELTIILVEKFTQELILARSLENQNVEENEHLRKCRVSLNVLPEDLRNQIQQMIENTERQIRECCLNRELNDINLDDYDLVGKYKDYKENNIRGAQKIKEVITKKSSLIIEELNKNHNNEKVIDFIDNLKKFKILYTNCENFELLSEFKTIKNGFKMFEEYLKDYFNKSAKEIDKLTKVNIKQSVLATNNILESFEIMIHVAKSNFDSTKKLQYTHSEPIMNYNHVMQNNQNYNPQVNSPYFQHGNIPYNYNHNLQQTANQFTPTMTNLSANLSSQNLYYNYTHQNMVNQVPQGHSQTYQELAQQHLQQQVLPKAQKVINTHFEKTYEDRLNESINKFLEFVIKAQDLFKNSFEENVFFFDSTVTKNYLILSKLFDSIKEKDWKYFQTDEVKCDDQTTVKEKIKARIDKLVDLLKNEEFPSEANSLFQSSFDKYFEDLSSKLKILKEIDENFTSIFKNESFEATCRKKIEEKMNNMYDQADQALANFFSSERENELKKFTMCYQNLLAAQKKSSLLNFKLKENKFDKIFREKIFAKVDEYLENLQNKNLEEATECFIKVQKLSQNFVLFQGDISEKLGAAIELYLSKNGGFSTMGKLAQNLQQNGQLGSMIVSKYKTFESHHRAMFNQKTSKRKIEHVLGELKGDIVDSVQLETLFKKFKKYFDELVVSNLNINIKNTSNKNVISNLKMLAKTIKTKEHRIEWDNVIKDKLPDLMAHIFGLWTLINSGDYFKLNAENRNYLFEPHPAQVLAVFRMLGLGYSHGNIVTKHFKKNELNNNLVQIGTGEGKSVTLAATAVVLALLGFEVYCVCYSKYLSDRDYKAFEELFKNLDLITPNKKLIHYGTFNQICEKLINQRGDLRKTIEELIKTGKTSSSTNSNSNRFKILLIDEVDVFFSKEFYGNSYQPSLKLTDPTITSLIKFIWSERSNNLRLRGLKESEAFKQCCNRFVDWQKLIEEACKDMLSDLNTYLSHDYVVQNDQIGYKEHDGIVFDTSYGYKTLFAYFHEHDKSNISEDSLNRNIYILVRLGSFSFAEIPKKEFSSILGVTGTLTTFNNEEVEKEYGIEFRSYIPSVYDQKKIRFNPQNDVMIGNEENHYNMLKGEIEKRIQGVDVGTKRAVFVFFETKKHLYDFYNSEQFSEYKLNRKGSVLTEEASVDEKNHIINNSTLSGRVTLFTRVFGRGTDFVIHDSIVSSKGGVHVIQTFLSEEYSEEVQIKGRTARQEEDGSFSMVIPLKSLEKYHIFKNDIDAHQSDLYEFLDKKRNEYFLKQRKESVKHVERIKDKHNTSFKFLESLHDQKYSEVKSFILNENIGLEGANCSKTLILMDATGSMTTLLEQTKNTLNVMFDRTFHILKKNTNTLNRILNKNSFQIKIGVYRNYSSGKDLIFQQSAWENKSENLITFLKGIYPEGGQGAEAIEIGLWNANEESDLSQVILIGDAPANSQQDVTEKRNIYGKTYWSQTKYKRETYYETELKKLVENDVKVHAFYVDKFAKQNFENIARFTNGKSSFLDINSEKGSNILIDLVTKQVLENIGGERLVQAYRTEYQSF